LTTVAAPGRPGGRPRTRGSALQTAAVCILLLLVLKRPDALFGAQFFAEDGRVFFHDQFLYGSLEALFIPYAGYLLFVPRLVAMFASLFPLVAEPTIYNGAALAIAAASCAVFCLPAFRSILAADALRFALCCVAAAALDTGELVGTITQIQWYLQFAGILLLLYSGRKDAPHNPRENVILAVVMLVIALSVPMLIMVAPLALWLIWRARGTARLPAVALLAGTAIQVMVYINAGASRGQNVLFGFHGLAESTAVYLAFRAVLSSLIGRPRAMVMCAQGTLRPTLLISAALLAWLAWLWTTADARRRRVILGCLYLAIVSAVMAIGARNLPRPVITFGGERYFFLSACCLVLLAAVTLERFAWRPRVQAAALMAIFSGGLLANFKVPAYADYQWAAYTELIARWQQQIRDNVNVHAIAVPINPPGWSFVLEGNVLDNGGFEQLSLFPWVGVGVGTTVSQVAPHSGKASLAMSGLEGDARQLVWGLKDGSAMRAEAMVAVPCTSNMKGTLVVEDGKRTLMGTAASDAAFCGHWQPLKVEFRVPPSQSALIRLQYQGKGDTMLWDDVQLQGDR
jgi:hypothetical protein